ncbi:MAG: ABC-ATPase UvrA [Planctomycetes bacterium]|nr:ABC-ATPase UvrA [Planctomycetota bacterium]
MTKPATIRIRGARTHNLRGVDVDIPHGRLVVLTGVSGSGKSSLAFDTIFAEGQRRFLESLSAYSRQFLDLLQRPDVDAIDGLPPTVSVDQRTGAAQPRSTLGTTTEILDYLRLLYARAGTAHCTGCGREVAGQSSQAIVERVLALGERRKVMLLAPVVRGRKGQHQQVFADIAAAGFVRARVDGEIADIAEPPALDARRRHTIEAVVDRLVLKEGLRGRVQESVDLALRYGEGTCSVVWQEDNEWLERLYSERFACPDCGLSFPTPEPRTFSFNSPYGACPTCDGLGVGAHPPSPPLSKGGAGGVEEVKVDVELDTVLACPDCGGSRLNDFARRVTIDGRSIAEVSAMSVGDAVVWAENLLRALRSSSPPFAPEGREVALRTLPEVARRLRFLVEVGLDYLTLDRRTHTLSGGEFQRARLAGCLGSGLIGTCFVLDEPTIGLHPRDTAKLLTALEELRNQGNTVLVVEHDIDTMRRADYLIDLGPGAGADGGRIVATGTPAEVATANDSLTARYLSHDDTATFPPLTKGGPGGGGRRARRLIPQGLLRLEQVGTHNLQNVTVEFPLGLLTCVTGVSGSGKSSLVIDSLVPAVRDALASPRVRARGRWGLLSGAEAIDRLVQVDQSPLGRSGRSNPATYSGVWNEVRQVFATTREARLRGFTARRFSFNSRDGRCETCAGRGTRRIEMQYLPDLFVACETCRGARFNRQTLSIRYRGKSVADVLAMRFDEALGFFENFPRIVSRLKTFVDVGLGYLCLGQSSLDLSGGEAQRVRLATELGRPASGRTLFVLDEPTTGLHPADVERLLNVLHQLVDRGDTAIAIEHHLDVMANSDWLIDLGPEAGAAGGEILFEGPPHEIASARGHTAAALSEFLSAARVTPTGG